MVSLLSVVVVVVVLGVVVVVVVEVVVVVVVVVEVVVVVVVVEVVVVVMSVKKNKKGFLPKCFLRHEIILDKRLANVIQLINITKLVPFSQTK